VESVSLTDVLTWVVLGGSLQVELFSYYQTDDLRFSSKPSVRRRMSLSFPSLLTITDELRQPVERWAHRTRLLPVPMAADADGERDDLAVLTGNFEVAVYRDVLPAEELAGLAERPVWPALLDRYDTAAGASRSVELSMAESVSWMPFPGSELLRPLEGRAPARRLTLGVPPSEMPLLREGEPPFLYAVDLDGDRVDEVFLVEVFGREGPVTLWILH
jgi:hypothetical protein